MRRVTPLIALVLAVAPAAGADAYTMKGHGNGHGVGMSQYGAYGYAKHGVGYRDILKHYYRHTSIGTIGSRKIRVLLEDGESTIPIAGASQAGNNGMNANITYRARLRGSKVVFYGPDGKRAFSEPSPVLVTGMRNTLRLGGTAINGVRDGAYRGKLELRASSSAGLAAINELAVDNYVKGVVPGEVPASWPADALKAQAVAARSYALTTDAGGDLFDQYPDTRSQVYRGMDGEQSRSNAAVKATAREVVKYHDDIATTYFFSASGGRTENIENSFTGSDPLPYLKSVKDPYDYYAPLHKWTIKYSKSEVASRLGGLVKGSFRGVRVVKRGVSPRVVLADVVGSKGKLRVSGATLRARLDLPDTWVSFPSFGSKREKAVAALPVPLLAPVAPETAATPRPPKAAEPTLEWPPNPL
jgi:stage II sporulation protein D